MVGQHENNLGNTRLKKGFPTQDLSEWLLLTEILEFQGYMVPWSPNRFNHKTFFFKIRLLIFPGSVLYIQCGKTTALKYECILPRLFHIYELRFLWIIAYCKGDFIVTDPKYMCLCMSIQIQIR